MKLKSLLLLALMAFAVKPVLAAEGELNPSTKISFEVIDPASLKSGEIAFIKLIFTNPEVEYAAIQCSFDYPEGWEPVKFSQQQAGIGTKPNKSYALVMPEGRLDETEEFEAFTVMGNEPNDASFRLAIYDGNAEGKKIAVGDDAILVFAVKIPEEPGENTDITVRDIWISTGNPGMIGDGAIDEFTFNIFSTPVYDMRIDKTVAGVVYYNLAGVESTKPFDGINVVVTTYTDGTRITSKILK